MKRDLFKARLLSLVALCSFMLMFASCANEGITQKKTDTDNNNDKNLTTFATGTAPESRTSMDYNSGAFFWEAGDYIYVKDDDGTWQKSSNAPTAKTASFRFRVPGKFSNNTTYKVYYPGKNGNKDQVTIPAAQTQKEPNTTAHFGESGDCGTADATGLIGGGTFNFKLDHQAAYLVFQPYTSNFILKKCYLTKVEVSSDNDISNTYTLDPTTGKLTGIGIGKQIVLTTKGSGANANGFPLTNSSADVVTNGAFMVIKPGTHKLTIRYWVRDAITGIEGTITKALSAHTFDRNKYYNMTANLNVRDYDGNHYYMWDAFFQCWYGYEWTHKNPAWQPTKNYTFSAFYPKSTDVLRWHNDSNPGFGVRNDASRNAIFQTIPNVNELIWYGVKGDPRWDEDELWTTMGHLYKGGIWLKKKAYITDYSTEHSVDGATDYRNTNLFQITGTPPSQTLPTASEAHQFFYLPALGSYGLSVTGGTLYDVGNTAIYWSSSASPGTSDGAYTIQFNKLSIYIRSSNRFNGIIPQPFE